MEFTQHNLHNLHNKTPRITPLIYTDLDYEMISFLQKYIQVDTSQPTPDYASAIAFLANQAAQDDMEYQVITLPSGNPVFVVTYRGTDPSLPALALNHHIDVVSATNIDRWQYRPFSGEIANGNLYGRGSSDIKGLGAVHYFALRELRDIGCALRRTVHLLMVPDEEVGGEFGAQEFVKTSEFADLNIGYVLDETEGSGELQALCVTVDEKKVFQIKFIHYGHLAHGSYIHVENVIHDMVRLLVKIADFQNVQKLNLHSQPIGDLTSMNITSIKAGVFSDGEAACNIIPDEVSAIVDIRIPPQMPIQVVRDYLDTLLKEFPRITYVLCAPVHERAPYNIDYEQSALWRALAAVAEKYQYLLHARVLCGATDLRYYLTSDGIQGFGFVPFMSKGNAHTTDEFIPLDELVEGRKIMRDLIVEFCH